MLLAVRLNDGTIPVLLPAAECVHPDLLRKALDIAVQSKCVDFMKFSHHKCKTTLHDLMNRCRYSGLPSRRDAQRDY